jgi:hypothetical protein
MSFTPSALSGSCFVGIFRDSGKAAFLSNPLIFDAYPQGAAQMISVA